MSLKEYLKTKLTLIAVLTLIGIVTTYFVCDSCHSSAYRYFVVALFSASLWLTMWLGNEFLVLWLDEKIEWTREPVKRSIVGALVTIVYTVTTLLFLLNVFAFVFDFRINTPTQTLYTTTGLSFFITLVMTSRSFLLNWRESAINAEKLQKESIAAKYESLKNQVNPHFLFNSFNALTNLVYEDQDKAARFIKQLSEVYRYVLDTRDKEVVTIDEELKFLQSYAYLQQIRFGNKLNIHLDITNTKAHVAPLALQMLIENAIKHNVASEEDPLYIKLYTSNDCITVENNLQKKASFGEASAGVGLENICKRYEFLSDRKVEIIQDEKRFIVKLPALTKS
jgi:sensor histidine kinase YesM